eukprot:Mrub_09116.p1 GENE.Mrub_09116~~Mrub_09116.p1  ORF type:complete len:218 (+),score=15.43 Mrub_09116:32-685(+)
MSKSSSNSKLKRKKKDKESSSNDEPIQGTYKNKINASNYITHNFEYEIISDCLYILLWRNCAGKMNNIFHIFAFVGLLVATGYCLYSIFFYDTLLLIVLFIVALSCYLYTIKLNDNVTVYKFEKKNGKVKCKGYIEGDEQNPFYQSKTLIKCKMQEIFDVNKGKGGRITIDRGYGILIKDKEEFHVLGYAAQPKDSRLKKCLKKLKHFMSSSNEDDI